MECKRDGRLESFAIRKKERQSNHNKKIKVESPKSPLATVLPMKRQSLLLIPPPPTLCPPSLVRVRAYPAIWASSSTVLLPVTSSSLVNRVFWAFSGGLCLISIYFSFKPFPGLNFWDGTRGPLAAQARI
jgi:hypothetical protein